MQFYARGINITAKPLQGFGNETIGVTDCYLTKNGAPWLPVMGEIHFSRVPCKDWEKELLKMKEGGIEIVSSYIFWNHHEMEEGHFCWEDNCNLRQFIRLCAKHSLYFFLRPGPWAHGEARYGGFPDWLVSVCGDDVRAERQPYLQYVQRFFQEIAKQVKGLDNIIGIQVENEMVSDPEYLLRLKQIIKDCGMHAPLFTATAWGIGKPIPSGELLPVYGGYPEAPWEQHTKRLSPNVHSFFTTERNDCMIGNDVIKAERINEAEEPAGKTPYITCEIGGGNQVTYHRRPVLTANDVLTLPFTMLGSGCNLLGYYMYHGGINPIINGTTMQETKESGYINDYPIISYDFQAPIGDCGQIRPSYYALRRLHRFVKCFGEMLAPMQSILPEVLPENRWDLHTLRAAFRTDGEKGFLFISNMQRLENMPSHENVNITFVLNQEKMEMQNLRIPANDCCILPVGLEIGGCKLRYATAQPLYQEDRTLYFAKIGDMEPVLFFEWGEILITFEGIQIGDSIVKLKREESFLPTAGKNVAVEKKENSLPFTNFEYLKLADKTQEFKLSWEESQSYLLVDVVGNVAQAYHNGELISDWFCNGTTWVIDVRDFEDREIIIKVQPLSGEDDIYFECAMPLNECAISAVSVAKEPVRILK